MDDVVNWYFKNIQLFLELFQFTLLCLKILMNLFEKKREYTCASSKNDGFCKCTFNIGSEKEGFVYNKFTLLKINLHFGAFCMELFCFFIKKRGMI